MPVAPETLAAISTRTIVLTEAVQAPILVSLVHRKRDIWQAVHFLKSQLYDPFGLRFEREQDTAELVHYVLARQGGSVVGAARLRLNPPLEGMLSEAYYQKMVELFGAGFAPQVVNFYGNAVLEKFQRQGIGRTMYDIREQLARLKGKTIGLSLIREASEPLFLRHLGYQVLGPDTTQTPKGPLERLYVAKLFA